MADASEVDDLQEQKPIIKLEIPEGSKMNKEPDSPRKSTRLLNSKPNNYLNSLKKRKGLDTGSDSDKKKVPKHVGKNQNFKNMNTKSKLRKVGKLPALKKAIVKIEKLSSDEEGGDDEEEDEYKSGTGDGDKFGPAMLGLHRVGDDLPVKEKKEPVQLNRRGMPQRIRKKNPLFFDESVVNHMMPKQRNKDKAKEKLKNKYKVKQEKKKEIEQKVVLTDKKTCQKIGLKLRNLLKLPKAQKWVCFEWFYSNIDKVLFHGSNDFVVCLRESFPQLKTTLMTRVEWCIVRRLMGKPRRCSQAFFEEERQELERKRSVIRQLQQRKMADVSNCKDLPDKVPMQLTIGQKVSARLRSPQDGLFTGTIDAVDTSNNTYRITFERHGLGTHSIPDFEVLSNEEPGMFSISTFIKRYYHSQNVKRRIALPPPRSSHDQKPTADMSRALSLGAHSSCKYDTYPTVLIENIARLQKILHEKRSLVIRLKNLNTEAEEKKSNGEDYTDRFRQNYAGLVIEFHRVNSALEAYLGRVQKMCHTVAPESSRAALLAPSYLRDKSKEEAQMLIEKYFKQPEKTVIKNKSMVDLVTSLVGLMIQVKSLSGSDRNAHELNVLKESMAHIKKQISAKNQDVFQDRVEVHMQFMESGLGPFGTLAPFSKQRNIV